MKEEIARTRHLHGGALEPAGLAANSPQSAVFGQPHEGFGYRTDKVQKRAFDKIKGLRARGLELRAGNLVVPLLQTSGAWPWCSQPTTDF